MLKVWISVLFVLGLVAAQTAVTGIPKPDIIENNHYFSETTTSKVYKITQLKSSIPLSVVIKHPTTASESSPLTLTLASDSEIKTCILKGEYNLCVLENVPSQSGTLQISCSSAPCEVSWTLYQNPINQLASSSAVQDLYQIPTGFKRMHISLSCNSKEVQDPRKLAFAFSNINTDIAVVEKSLVISFPDPSNGFVMIKKNPDFKDCLTMAVHSVKQKLTTDLESDLIKKGQTVTYPLADIPHNVFRFDMQFNNAVTSAGGNNVKITIAMTGKANGQHITIRSNQIQYPGDIQHYDITFAVPKIDSSVYSDVNLEITSQGSSLFVEFQLATDDHILVEPTQRCIFDLKKGEKLPFRLIAEEHAEKGDKVNIYLSDKNALTSTKSACDFGPECDFDVQARSDIKGMIYLGAHEQTSTSRQVVILDFKEDMKFTKKVKEFSETYIKKKVQLQKALKVAVNTPNVVVYMATSKKECGLPAYKCYDAIGNIHKNFLFTPETDDDSEVIFLIKALDDCEFTLSLLEEKTEFLQLVDSQPFAYQLSNKQQQMEFKFTRNMQIDVSFNLIAPLHSLDLIVENSKKLPKDLEDAEISAEGFITFAAKQAKKNQFSILVRKRDAYQGKTVHFTIIASTSGKQIRLETAITHYQTLPKQSQSNAEYVFEFNHKQDYVINFYSHNAKNQELDISLFLATNSKQIESVDAAQKMDVSKLMQKFTIDQASDKIDLSEVSEELCTASGEDSSNCELFMFLKNNMDMEIDIAITLMSRDALVELKDGIWQGFNMNSVAKTAHFFFYPHNHKQDITVFYKTQEQNVRLKYRLFYGNDDKIDPLQWPFPNNNINQDQSAKLAKFKPVNQISISKQQFINCWPHCVLLISLVQLNVKYTDIERETKFSIMASNSIMEIPEKEKIEVTMMADEEKIYLIDLKYALDKEKDIYINVFHTMGLVNLYVNVYSERNNRVPDEDQADFKLLAQDEMKLPISVIKQLLEKEEMDEHKDIYLYIVAQAVSDSKFSIEFELNEEDEEKVKMMSFDTFQHVKLPAKSSKLFYTSIEQPFQIKIQRTNGFPFYTTETCNDKLDDCISNFKDSDEKGTQLLTKVIALSEKPCQNCYQMLKVSTQEDPAEAIVHLQSSISQVQLAESKTVYDFIQGKEENKYLVFALKTEQTFINIDVSEGEVEVQVTDFHKVDMKKSGSTVVSFSIPASVPDLSSITSKEKYDDLSEQEKAILKEQAELIKQDKGPAVDAYTYSSTFTAFYVTVRSSLSSPSIYTITYSSGEREFDLQDGLITEYFLEEDKEHVFYYSSKNAGHAYLTISTEKASDLKDLEIALKFCEPKGNIIDEQCWQEYSAPKPPIKDKAPNPSIMYSLPAKNYFAVFLQSKNSKGVRVSLGINHQQIMILPFDKEFPFALHQAENINFLVELSNPGYIQITVRKCDESNPTFAYTYDYEGFQDGEFTYETDLSENPKTNFYSKVKPGTLYIRFSSPDSQSLLSLQVHFQDKKIKDQSIRPGNNGDMTYAIVDSSTAQLSLHPPTCAKGECSKIKYVLITATKMRDLYTQLVCPSNFFSSYENLSIDPIKEQEVQPKTNSDGTLSITFNLVDQISYVGLKVMHSKGISEAFYRPIEVATLWGQLSRTSHTHKLAISTIFICGLLVVIIMVRRNARRGYKPIEDQI